MSNHSSICQSSIKILSLIRILLSVRNLQWVEWGTVKTGFSENIAANYAEVFN